jgi:hypothetical protein
LCVDGKSTFSQAEYVKSYKEKCYCKLLLLLIMRTFTFCKIFQMLILLFVVHGGMESHSQHYIGEVHFVQDIRFWYVSVFVEIFFHFIFLPKKKERKKKFESNDFYCLFFFLK